MRLPAEGPGFQTIHLANSSFWGAPSTIARIEKLGDQVHAAGLGDLYIEDISRPRGGPLPGGHVSHQLGLDVDVGLDVSPKPTLSAAQRETIERMRPLQSWDSVNIMALIASIASLNDPEQVTNSRRLNDEAKAFVIGELDTMGYEQIPSEANFIMFNVKRPVVPLIQAMKQRNVHVGRLFPALPNHMRLTIGKKAEMEAFLQNFRKIIV